VTGNGLVVSRVLVIEPRASLAALIVESLNASLGVEVDAPPDRDAGSAVAAIASVRFDAVVYSPLDERARDLVPDTEVAGAVLGACARSGVRRIVLISSAAVYGADYHNPGLIRESRPTSARCLNRVAEAWRAAESLAARLSAEDGRIRLAVLRPAMTRVDGANDWVNRLLRQRWAVTVAGYNPSIQLLEANELARAICLAVDAGAEGAFNIAPDGVIPLRQALRAARVRRIPMPWTLQRLGRAALRPLGVSTGYQQEYLRYSWTVSNERSRSELGMRYGASSIVAARAAQSRAAARPASPPPPTGEPERFDDFGMDEHFIRVRSRRALDFMDRHYWRIEVRGLEHIPRQGRAILVGVHRGFMPFDGVMMVHLLEKHLGRIPRFLMHPGLVKFPILAPFLTNLGGIIACQENADHVLGRDEVLGIFPEGIRGAFRMYRDAYTLDRFGRSDFVKMALRHRAPIVPFVFLGTAEMFPILGKIEWSWWKRNTEWPFIPITPTFPLLPVPLPTKWHLQVLPPLVAPEADGSEAADDPRLVRRIGDEVRDRMQQALDAMRRRRRSVFFGSIFDDAETPEEPVGRPALDVPLAATSRNLETTAP
jgi:1-acyl-sn-glycerol-3-phosphate acyltransferase/nucleoside-diphosphate-sugar epimerase